MTMNPHDEAFFRQMAERREPYRRLAECIDLAVGRQETALDIGCGIGLQTRRLQELGWGIVGADYAPAALAQREPDIVIEPLDLTSDLSRHPVQACVICTETAEHIPAEHANTIVRNVAGLARDFIVWSAAQPGQDWPGHVNLQPPAYWLNRFEKEGWIRDNARTDVLRTNMCLLEAQHASARDNFFVLIPKPPIEHFYEKIPGYFTFTDFYWWLARTVPRGAHGVEVGSYAGRSAAFLAVELHNVHRRGRLDLVDTFTVGGLPEQVRASLHPVAHIIGELHQGDSAETAARYADSSLDFVFIDADHTYPAVRRDIDAWLPKVRAGGIIAGHDFRTGFGFGVVEAVTETFAKFEVWRGDFFTGDGVRVFLDRTGLNEFYPTWAARVPERPVQRPPHITIVSTALNAEKWAARCIESVQRQTFKDWTHIYVDAKSEDQTARQALRQIARGEPSKTRLLVNETRKAALENAVEVWNGLPDDEIVVWLDGDDWLAHDRALDVVVRMYSDPNVWLTYGQFMIPDGEVGFAGVRYETTDFRNAKWRASHLKTFRAGLAKKINPIDLHKPDGSWCNLAIDHAVMFPLLEMAGERYACSERVLCVYNYDASYFVEHVDTNAERVRAEQEEDERMRAMPPYTRLASRPW